MDYGPTYSEFSDGRITGGFTPGEPVRPGGPLVILYAEDLKRTELRLKAAGATISRRYSRFQVGDPDGYELAVWSADSAS